MREFQYLGERRKYNDNNQLHCEDGPAVVYPNKAQHWYINGERHRVDGPAITKGNGDYSWWLDGKLHREGGPAISTRFKTCWYRNGELHREDGPAKEEHEIRKNRKIKSKYEWYQNGFLHREEGPAIEALNELDQQWWFQGRRHRDDGPAKFDPDGRPMWFLQGKHFKFVEWLDRVDLPIETKALLKLRYG